MLVCVLAVPGVGGDAPGSRWCRDGPASVDDSVAAGPRKARELLRTVRRGPSEQRGRSAGRGNVQE
jgi:hypothetical protein